MEIKNVMVVRTDDWVALYVNGQLANENHSLRPEEVLEALGIEYNEASFAQSDVEANGFVFPKDLRELYTWSVDLGPNRRCR